MKLLGLFRHAKSEWDAAVTRDFDRGLNERGRIGSGVMGDHIRAHGIEWDRLIASPAIRVTETLKLGVPEMPVTLDEKLYLASSDTIMEVVAAHAGEGADEADAILISGHNPGLQETILELVSPSHENDLFKEACVKFPTASYAVLECNIDSWSALRPRCAKLVHFTRPRDVDPDLGPAD